MWFLSLSLAQLISTSIQFILAGPKFYLTKPPELYFSSSFSTVDLPNKRRTKYTLVEHANCNNLFFYLRLFCTMYVWEVNGWNSKYILQCGELWCSWQWRIWWFPSIYLFLLYFAFFSNFIYTLYFIENFNVLLFYIFHWQQKYTYKIRNVQTHTKQYIGTKITKIVYKYLYS